MSIIATDTATPVSHDVLVRDLARVARYTHAMFLATGGAIPETTGTRLQAEFGRIRTETDQLRPGYGDRTVVWPRPAPSVSHARCEKSRDALVRPTARRGTRPLSAGVTSKWTGVLTSR